MKFARREKERKVCLGKPEFSNWAWNPTEDALQASAVWQKTNEMLRSSEHSENIELFPKTQEERGTLDKEGRDLDFARSSMTNQFSDVAPMIGLDALCR